MDLNQLNDDCLLHLFGYFSLQNKIHFRIVCRRWQTVVEISFRSQTTMKLFGSFANVNTYCRSLLRYNFEDDHYLKLSPFPTHNEIICTYRSNRSNQNLSPSFNAENLSKKNLANPLVFLARLFPNIKHLVSCFSGKIEVESLSDLLTEWSHSLVSLTLFMYPNNDILRSISVMHSLRRLDLLKTFTDELNQPNFDNCYNYITNDSIERLSSVLFQLEHLSLGYYLFEFIPIFTRIGPNIKHLMLQWRETKDFYDMLQLSHPNVCNITHLKLHNTRFFYSHDLKVLQFVCRNFPSLTNFDFSVNPSTTFESIIENLVPLDKLSNLKLCFYANYDTKIEDMSYTPSINPQTKCTALLKSITTLQLKNSHLLLYYRPFYEALRRFFPSVQELIMAERCSKMKYAQMRKTLAAYPQYKQSKGIIDNLQKQSLYWISVRGDLSDFVGTHQQLYRNFTTLVREVKRDAETPQRSSNSKQCKRLCIDQAASVVI